MDHKAFAEMDCPNPVTWTNDIKKLFTPLDVSHMKQVTMNALDLSDYQSVKIWATKIYQEVSSGAMPPFQSGESRWTPAMVSTFGCWIKQSCPM